MKIPFLFPIFAMIFSFRNVFSNVYDVDDILKQRADFKSKQKLWFHYVRAFLGKKINKIKFWESSEFYTGKSFVSNMNCLYVKAKCFTKVPNLIGGKLQTDTVEHYSGEHIK